MRCLAGVIDSMDMSLRKLWEFVKDRDPLQLLASKIKPATVSTVFPSICHEVMGPDAMILVF